jgi:hypothetical protein
MSRTPPLEFISLTVCRNPMEAEIVPAALREAEVPHRTEWRADGGLDIQVPAEWAAEAQAVLARAQRVFFGQTGADPAAVQSGGSRPPAEPETDEHAPATTDADPELEDEFDDGGSLFGGDALPTPGEMRLRPLWPAWALAAVPGAGLGHLYAGRLQMFFYLLFCSALGILFHHLTGSWWSFLLVAFAWGIDLGFAPGQVEEHNRRARRARRRLADAERSFLDSL